MEQAAQTLMGREVEGRPLFMREDRTAIEKEEGFVVFVSRRVCVCVWFWVGGWVC